MVASEISQLKELLLYYYNIMLEQNPAGKPKSVCTINNEIITLTSENEPELLEHGKGSDAFAEKSSSAEPKHEPKHDAEHGKGSAAEHRIDAIPEEPDDDDAPTAPSPYAKGFDSEERNRAELYDLSRAPKEKAESVVKAVAKEIKKAGHTIEDYGGGVEESKEGGWTGDDEYANDNVHAPEKRFAKVGSGPTGGGLRWTKKGRDPRETPFAFDQQPFHKKPLGSGVSRQHDRAVGGTRTKGRRTNKNKSRSRKHKKTSVRRKKRIGAFKRRRHKTKKNIRTRRHTR